MPFRSKAQLKIAYFGLPLGALLLAADHHELGPCVLSPIPAPGARRLRNLVPELLDARQLGPALEHRVAQGLQARTPDLLVSWFWTRRLPEAWLHCARLGAIGVHPSLLPRHRGPNPYFWAIDAGDSSTGVSVHLLERDYDTGDVLESEAILVGDLNAWQLARALDRPSLRALRRVVAAYARGEPPRGQPQQEALATPAPEPSGDLLRVSFDWPSSRVLRRIRALSPVPGLALSLGGRDFFVVAAKLAPHALEALLPGEAQIKDNRLMLRTRDGAISVERVVLADSTDESTPRVLAGDDLAKFFRELIDSEPLEVA